MITAEYLRIPPIGPQVGPRGGAVVIGPADSDVAGKAVG